MSELPPELTRVPPGSLDVLRYFGNRGIEGADSDQIATGTGMSARAIGKAIRGLVTKGYLNMDDAYVYHLNDRGIKAVEDVLAYDASSATSATKPETPSTVEQFLVAVLPNPLGHNQTSTLQISLDRIPQIADTYQLILRLSTTSGSINPAEVSLDLYPNQAAPIGETYFTPADPVEMVRIRVEATQVGMMDAYVVGGMYIDIPMNQHSGGLNAWYGGLKLIE